MNAAYLCLAASLCTLLGGCGSPEFSVSPTRAEGRCDAALVGTWQMPEKPDAGIRIDAQCRIHDRNGSNPWAPSVHTAPSPRGGERLAWLQTPPDEGGRWLLAELWGRLPLLQSMKLFWRLLADYLFWRLCLLCCRWDTIK